MNTNGNAHLELEARPGRVQIKAGVERKISSGRVRTTRRNDLVIATITVENDDEGPYEEEEADVRLEATSKNLTFGANVRKKVSAGRVRKTCNIESRLGNATAEIDTEGPYQEAEAHVRLEATSKHCTFGANVRKKVSTGRVRKTCNIESRLGNATAEVDAEGPYREAEAHVHLEATSKHCTFGANVRKKVSTGRVRKTCNIESRLGNVTAEIDTEGPYQEAEAHVHLEATSKHCTFGANVRKKVSAGRVRANYSIESRLGNATAEVDAEGPYQEAEAHVHLEATRDSLQFGAGFRARASLGRVSGTCSVGNSKVDFDAEGPYTDSESQMCVKVTPGTCVIKANARAKASAGQIRVTAGNVSVEANGPNVSASFVSNHREARLMVGAEIASTTVSAGPVEMKFGFGVETGVHVGHDGAEVKFLGCGFTVGKKTGFSLFGNELKL